MLSEQDLSRYVAALERNGFFGPDSWYMNHARNIEFAARAKNGGRLAMPVLFLHAAHDYTCDTTHSRLAEPMRQDCADLTYQTAAELFGAGSIEQQAVKKGWADVGLTVGGTTPPPDTGGGGCLEALLRLVGAAPAKGS